MKNSVFILLLIVFFALSCSKTANDGIPAYVSVQNVVLETAQGEGSSIHGITTLWAESEGEDFGAHELPIVFPVLVSGNRQFIANAGVQRSGDFFFREIYQPYQPYTVNLEFVPGDTLKIEPTFRYKSNVEFIFLEDFESSNIFSALTRTNANDENNLEGRCVTTTLNENNPSVDAIMNNGIQISRNGKIYVELHYKGTNDIGVGVEGFDQGLSVGASFFTLLEPTPEWRKVHLDVTNLINVLDAQEYKFFLRSALMPGLQESNIFIDNFQIIKI